MNKDINTQRQARKEASETRKLFKAIATRGDQTALEQLFYLYSGRINAYAQTLLVEKDSSEDIVTEVFVKIAYLESLASIKNPIGWMFFVTKNFCFNANRHVKYSQDIDDDEVRSRIDCSATQSSEEFNRELAMLPEMQREIVLLEVIGNMTQRDIAEQLHLTRSRVRKERDVALDKLEKALDKTDS